MMRKRYIELSLAGAVEIEQLALKAHGSAYPYLPEDVGAKCKGVFRDPVEAERTGWKGWVLRPVSAIEILDDAGNSTGRAKINAAPLGVPTPTEIPDPTERAAETARVNARLARLTPQERVSVAQAIAQGGGEGRART